MGRASRLRLHHIYRNGTVSRDFAPNCLVPPSEGGLFSRISASPSEGAQSPDALCSACDRDCVSSRLVPPSEGELFSRISASPSEGALSKRHCLPVPLPQRHRFPRFAAAAVCLQTYFSDKLTSNSLTLNDFVTIWRKNATFRQTSACQSPLVHNLRYPLSNARKGGRNGDPGEGYRKDSRKGRKE